MLVDKTKVRRDSIALNAVDARKVERSKGTSDRKIFCREIRQTYPFSSIALRVMMARMMMSNHCYSMMHVADLVVQKLLFNCSQILLNCTNKDSLLTH